MAKVLGETCTRGGQWRKGLGTREEPTEIGENDMAVAGNWSATLGRFGAARSAREADSLRMFSGLRSL